MPTHCMQKRARRSRLRWLDRAATLGFDVRVRAGWHLACGLNAYEPESAAQAVHTAKPADAGRVEAGD
jgi:hypothetical protein